MYLCSFILYFIHSVFIIVYGCFGKEVDIEDAEVVCDISIWD